MRAERRRDLRRGVRGRHRDVHVEPEDRDLLGYPAELFDDALVPRGVGDLLVLPAGERMSSGRRDQCAAPGGRVAQVPADLADLVDGRGDPVVDARGRFEHGGHQLLADPLVRRLGGDLVEARDELVALCAEELVLLLDPDRERRAAAESRHAR